MGVYIVRYRTAFTYFKNCVCFAMQPPLDSNLMRGFLAVVDAGSVTRAADQMGRTQSAVSMQIRRLEESLGQSIFVREPHGVSPVSSTHLTPPTHHSAQNSAVRVASHTHNTLASH